MVAVGAVVVNRVNSGSFPNSISGVIYQGGQFTPVATGTFQSVLSAEQEVTVMQLHRQHFPARARLADACISTAATAAEFRSDISIFIKNRRGTFAGIGGGSMHFHRL